MFGVGVLLVVILRPIVRKVDISIIMVRDFAIYYFLLARYFYVAYIFDLICVAHDDHVFRELGVLCTTSIPLSSITITILLLRYNSKEKTIQLALYIFVRVLMYIYMCVCVLKLYNM